MAGSRTDHLTRRKQTRGHRDIAGNGTMISSSSKTRTKQNCMAGNGTNHLTSKHRDHSDKVGNSMIRYSRKAQTKENDMAGNRTNRLTRKKTTAYSDTAGNNMISSSRKNVNKAERYEGKQNESHK